MVSDPNPPYLNFYLDYLAGGRPASIPIRFISTPEAIQFVRSLGGIPILAHPAQVKDERLLELIGVGLEGIEVYSSYHGTEDEDYFKGVCDRFGLLMTAGSDFHGREIKPNVPLDGLWWILRFSGEIEVGEKSQGWAGAWASQDAPAALSRARARAREVFALATSRSGGPSLILLCARSREALVRLRSISSGVSAESAKTMALFPSVKRNPPLTAIVFFSPPGTVRVKIPGCRLLTKGVWPLRIPKYPTLPGAVRPSTSPLKMSFFRVTTSRLNWGSSTYAASFNFLPPSTASSIPPTI